MTAVRTAGIVGAGTMGQGIAIGRATPALSRKSAWGSSP